MISARGSGWAKVLLLYVFGTSLALYPPLAKFAMPVIRVSFLAILASVCFSVGFLNRPVRDTVLFKVAGVLFFVHVAWLFVAVLYGNDLVYMAQDSMGFVIYLLIPVIYVFLDANGLQERFFGFVLNLCTFLAGVSTAILVWYYLTYGAVEAESLLLMNAFLQSQNLNLQVDNNAGLLGLYTYTAQLLLLGIGLAYYRYHVTRQSKFIYLLLLYCVGIVADGHRALVVAMLLLILLLLPLLRKSLQLRTILIGALLVLVPLLLLLALDSQWLLTRFNFTADDPSTRERFLQVPALLERIAARPVFGNGFGAFARVIRSHERPFSYEVDFLATLMKLGIVGGVAYFGTYLFMLDKGRRSGGMLGYILFSVGLSFLFYMGTNGNSAMSTDASVFHMFIFLLIGLLIQARKRGLAPDPAALYLR